MHRQWRIEEHASMLVANIVEVVRRNVKPDGETEVIFG